MSSTDTGLTVKESTIEEEADRILNKVSTLTEIPTVTKGISQQY